MVFDSVNSPCRQSFRHTGRAGHEPASPPAPVGHNRAAIRTVPQNVRSAAGISREKRRDYPPRFIAPRVVRSSINFVNRGTFLLKRDAAMVEFADTRPAHGCHVQGGHGCAGGRPPSGKGARTRGVPTPPAARPCGGEARPVPSIVVDPRGGRSRSARALAIGAQRRWLAGSPVCTQVMRRNPARSRWSCAARSFASRPPV